MRGLFRIFAVALVFGSSGSHASAGLTTLFDTGTPNTVLVDGSSSFLGYISGNANANQPQRWSAIPFTFSQSATIQQMNIYWFGTNLGGTNVNYTIWNRNALNAPTTVFSSGILGGYSPPNITFGIVPATYSTNISVPAGTYYFTFYATNPDGSPATLDWFTGGHQSDPSLEQSFMWRSAMFPNPGFQMYDPSNIQPEPGQDQNDRWTECFTFFGSVVPEPSSLTLFALGVSGLIGMRGRKRISATL